ncbi:MAG TPA: DUF5107 domain-containing protein [Christensenellaceae bacterium]|nr:DUF5107 domain-containing protein [Christensenellaceae bacterium]
MQKVIVTDETRLMPTYDSPAAEELPMFAENRVHQRSSGNPYPCKVVMRVNREHRSEKPIRIITLENEYLRIELMPELGGRIYSAFDKRTEYDFFYKQHVIKPALIGLLGSWISGGCEFNWPCHHRPSTYMPVDVSIEEHPNGAVTVWMSENEPLNRMKGMVGIYLAPGEARFDTKMKIYNRTATRHSFLWWENAAVPVNQQYRLVFPPDVTYVQFHYCKDVASYPVAGGVYNGIRMGDGVDISYHKNTHQPTSYFCAESKYDFFGGYDEGKRCGVIHVADHTVSVGKKMFTWAYNQLASSWEKALTDTDGAYAELMASSYSLNQPDFTWLMPYEGKEFSQMWYPIGDIGTPLCACREAAISIHNGELRLQATVALNNAELEINEQRFPLNVSPKCNFSTAIDGDVLSFILRSSDGSVLLKYTKPNNRTVREMPAALPDNPSLDKLYTAQELYLMGVHVEQYRDPATRAEAYWREAIRRDPEYVPALTSLANSELNHFRFDSAYDLAMRAWKKITTRNFHPESGELQYVLGRILEAQGEDDQAWEWYMQSAWTQNSRSRALTRAAMIKGRQGDRTTMGRLAEEALKEHTRNETAQLMLALSHTKDPETMNDVLNRLWEYDRLNPVCRALQHGAIPSFYHSLQSDACQTLLDVAEDLADMGEVQFACELLKNLPKKCAQTEYVLWYLSGDPDALQAAAKLGNGIAWPSRMLEYKALTAAIHAAPEDANARNLLACLLYHHGHYQQAETLWEQAYALAPESYQCLRNMAIARYSHLNRRDEALALLDRALALKPHDSQLVWEKAHVMLYTSQNPNIVAAFLIEENNLREDVTIALCHALNLAGRHKEVLKIMRSKRFTPCEGGEHAVAEQYMFAHHALGRKALVSEKIQTALEHFQQAQVLPDNLGAGLWNDVLLVPHRYFEAVCLQKHGMKNEAARLLDWILLHQQDYFTDMHLPELPCWQAMARTLHCGYVPKAREQIAAHLRAQESAATAIDPGYGKTTPFFISYMEDTKKLRTARVDWQCAMAYFAAGDTQTATKLAQKSLQNDPTNLYATLFCNS